MTEPSGSRKIYDGDLFDVVVEDWNGREREIVEHPGATAVVAIDREGYVTLVRQTGEAVRKQLVELPAGTLEAGEEPLASAQRELAEEVGLRGEVVRWRVEEIPERLSELEDAKTLAGLLLYLRTRP